MNDSLRPIARCTTCGSGMDEGDADCLWCDRWLAKSTAQPPPLAWHRIALVIGVTATITAMIITAIAALSGCVTRIQCPTTATMPTVPGALITESELRAEWTKRFGPLPSPACDPVMQWRVRTDEQTQIDCQTAKWGYKHVAGCGMYLPGNCPMAVISERSKDDAGLQAHEWSHWVLGCVWRGTWVGNTHPPGVTAEGFGDPYHTLARVWGGAGSASFEGYFRAKYASEVK